TAHSVSTPTGVRGGVIPFEYTVSDPDGDVVGVQIEYSVNGDPWQIGTTTADGDGAEAVVTETSPVTRTVHWSAQLDLPGVISSNVLVRVTPIDVLLGTPAQSGALSVNLVAPIVRDLSIGGIPEEMNGSLPVATGGGQEADYLLSVPSYGFQLTLEYTPGVGGGALDLSTLSIRADRPLGEIPASAELAPRFAVDGDEASWLTESQHAIGYGPVTFRATVKDTYGNVSDTASLTVKAVSATTPNRPFDFNDRWWLDFDGDRFATSFSTGIPMTITTEATPNGVADFDEDLVLLGLRSSAPTPECAAIDSNGRLRAWILTETKGRLDEHYGRSFDGSGDGINPALTFSLDSAGATSSIRVGGDDLSSGFTLGRAQFDYRNLGGNHNRSVTLGVFTTNMIQFYVNSSYSFRNRFDPLIPGRGTPAGEGPYDHIVLAPGFDPLDPGNDPDWVARYDDITAALDGLARSTAAVLAHEIGHSLGLCANDLPPLGLFGGVTAPEFAGPYTTAYHFDSPGNNLMAAALSFSTALISTSSGYRFSPLNEAYLREWIMLEQ
ncbi:MAG: hypothetical protein KDC38_20950, partial [Planctomycetes bacterium]|nr:hypothetical protein [Planctomycetota bacterium]